MSTYQACGNPASVAAARCRQLAAALRVAPDGPAAPGAAPCYALSVAPRASAPAAAAAAAAAAATLILLLAARRA